MVHGIVLMEDRFVYVLLRPVATNIFPLNSLRHSPSHSIRPSDCVLHKGVCSKAECRALMRRWHKKRMVSEEELLACNSWHSIESCSLTCTVSRITRCRLLLNQHLSCFEFQ